MTSASTRTLQPLEERSGEPPEPVCPTCDQPLAKDQLHLVRQRLADQERMHTLELERLRSEERVASEARASAQVAEVEKVAAARLQELEDAKALELQVARQEATEQANAAMTDKLAESEEKQKAAATQIQTLVQSYEEQLAKVSKEATDIANTAAALKLTQVEKLKKDAEEQLEAFRQNQDSLLAEQREALEADKVKAINAEKATAFTEKQKLDEQLQSLQRELARQTANELGEGAEIDLYEALRAEFPVDKITRIKKGEAGADILQEIIDHGVSCGSIVYDSKNRKAWRNSYSEKLRKDQLAAKADHAVLTTHAFPSGCKQLHLQDGVILANPARALVIAALLRKHVINTHSLRLSTASRDGKMVELYEYITSEHFAHEMEQLEDLAEQILELDVKEKKSHDSTWNRRGSLVRSIQRLQGNLSSDIDRVLIQSLSDAEVAG